MKLVMCREPEMLGGAWYTTASCPKFPLHVEEELELNFMLCGSALVFADGMHYSVSRGDLVWLQPGHLHGLVQASADLAMWVVSVRRRALQEARRCDPYLATGHAAEVVRLEQGHFTRLSARCFALLRAQREPVRFNQLLVDFLVDAHVVSASARSEPEEVHRAVARAAELLERPGPRWSLPRLAERVRLSPSELSRQFHRQLGVTLVHYANHQRVQLFGRLHAERPTATVLRKALDAGFESYSQFYRTFRAVTNLAPDEFRSLLDDGTLPSLKY